MIDYAELVALERSRRGAPTLSVYLDGEVASPGTRDVWRRRLEHALDEIRAALGDATAERREAFEHAVERLRALLAPCTGALGAAGWGAFVSADAVHFASPLPVPVQQLAVWEDGIRAAPLLRALRVHRPALLCITDGRATRLWRWRHGKLERVETLPPLSQPEPDPGEVAALADRLVSHATIDAWLLVGGDPARATVLAGALPPRVARRVQLLPVLSPVASDFELTQAAERATTALRRSYETAVVDALLATQRGDAADAGSVAGAPEAARTATRAGDAELLVLTRRFAERSPALVEAIVRDAFDRGVLVEEVNGAAAERLDARGGVGVLPHAASYRGASAGARAPWAER
jgi:hypothetical protein